MTKASAGGAEGAETGIAVAQAPDEARDAADDDSVWCYAMASRAHLVVDAAAYFDVVREAMTAAEARIFLIGWDFDTRILLSDGRRWWQRRDHERHPARLGSFMVWLVQRRPNLDVRLLKWNFSLFKSLLRGTMVFDLMRWARRPQIRIKFDSAHPVGCSHHQKIVVIDDSFAVCGGIDVTSERWDTPDHLPVDPRRKRPGGATLYDPWHDVTMIMEGEVAGRLAELGARRWEVAGGGELPPCPPVAGSPWPEDVDAEFRDVEVGIARTRAAWGNCEQVSEIEELFVRHIQRARRFVYAETQYFASRRIAEAICKRLTEADPPEFCIINPVSADGWLEQVAMDTARVQLVRTLQKADRLDRFHIFTPLAEDGTPIYVHAKMMIVDDEVIRVGSANMNNRSMGLDSECDVFIDAARPVNAHAAPAIAAIRRRMLAEHCGIPVEDVSRLLDEHGSMAGMIASLERKGKRLEPLRLQRLTETEKALAGSSVLDPERPGEMFEPIARRRGLFRRGGLLRRVHLMQRIRRRVTA